MSIFSDMYLIEEIRFGSWERSAFEQGLSYFPGGAERNIEIQGKQFWN